MATTLNYDFNLFSTNIISGYLVTDIIMSNAILNIKELCNVGGTITINGLFTIFDTIFNQYYSSYGIKSVFRTGDYCQYSEQLMSNNDDINQLLNSFLSSSDCVNGVKLSAYSRYVDGFISPTAGTGSINFRNQISSSYFIPKLLSSENTLNQYSYGSTIADHGASLGTVSGATDLSSLINLM
jgi:hypothetical protein